jgi:DNA replication protein DnaC
MRRDGVDHPRYLLRLIELELIDRERRMVERRIRAARFPAVKSFDSFDFTGIPASTRCWCWSWPAAEYVLRRENIIALGNSGTGKTHVALALGLAACQKGLSVGFTTAAALVNQLLEARDEKRLLRLQRELRRYKLLIVDELGYVPLSQTGAELLFEVFSQRYERGSTIVTSNLPFEDWTGGPGIRAADRRAARPAHPPRQHPGHERRQLPPQAANARALDDQIRSEDFRGHLHRHRRSGRNPPDAGCPRQLECARLPETVRWQSGRYADGCPGHSEHRCADALPPG